MKPIDLIREHAIRKAQAMRDKESDDNIVSLSLALYVLLMWREEAGRQQHAEAETAEEQLIYDEALSKVEDDLAVACANHQLLPEVRSRLQKILSGRKEES